MRLIDADALDVIGYTDTDGRPNTFDAGVIWTLEKMDAMPTIDAVPVVRCRECVHFEPFRRHDGFCKIDGMLRDNDFFCKCGKRREDGGA